MEPYQERVVLELEELNVKRDKLKDFIGGKLFLSLPVDERERLNRQSIIMASYASVLGERIANFKS